MSGTVIKDNLKGPGGPENAGLNCFLPNFSIVLYPLWAVVGGDLVGGEWRRSMLLLLLFLLFVLLFGSSSVH